MSPENLIFCLPYRIKNLRRLGMLIMITNFLHIRLIMITNVNHNYIIITMITYVNYDYKLPLITCISVNFLLSTTPTIVTTNLSMKV